VVTLGFIVEGGSEKIILESPAFREYMQKNGFAFIPDVIDIEGGGKLLPEHREESVQILKDKGATHILILADLEDAPCITSVIEKIAPGENQDVVISKKTLEAWYLADTAALHRFLGSTEYSCEYPESYLPALEEIKRVRLLINKQGVSNKKILARKMLKSQFTIENAAAHQNCPSAKYFLQKIKALSQN
jgi:hypothetical protein